MHVESTRNAIYCLVRGREKCDGRNNDDLARSDKVGPSIEELRVRPTQLVEKQQVHLIEKKSTIIKYLFGDISQFVEASRTLSEGKLVQQDNEEAEEGKEKKEKQARSVADHYTKKTVGLDLSATRA